MTKKEAAQFLYQIADEIQSLLDKRKGQWTSQKRLEALSMAISALYVQEENRVNRPLTLDEVYKRNGKPIWICGLPGHEIKWIPGWRILQENRVPMRSNNDAVLSHWTADYGRTWIAYDHEPEEELK